MISFKAASRIVALLLCFLAQIAVSAEADSCPEICPDIYLPVCGSNDNEFKRFPNKCEMDAFNCKLGRDASQLAPLYKAVEIALCTAASEINKDDCLKRPCPLIYAPVCATKGTVRKSFPNMCAFEVGNCVDRNAWKLLRSASC